MPLKLRKELSEDPFYKVCARKGYDCRGRITWEHSWLYCGRQIQEAWSVIPLCVFHHLGDGLDKDLNRYLALCRANLDDLCKGMPKKDWRQEFKYLKSKYENKS